MWEKTTADDYTDVEILNNDSFSFKSDNQKRTLMFQIFQNLKEKRLRTIQSLRTQFLQYFSFCNIFAINQPSLLFDTFSQDKKCPIFIIFSSNCDGKLVGSIKKLTQPNMVLICDHIVLPTKLSHYKFKK